MSFVPGVSQLQRTCRSVAVAMFALVTGVAAGRAQGPDPSLASRSKGMKTAPVTVYEMADFQCPVCRQFAKEVFPVVEQEFINTGKVRWVFINFPLTSIHANAVAAADFAACASKQGKFWPAHDLLYATQDRWEKLRDPAPFFMSQVGAVGLRESEMASCLQMGVGAAIVRDDAAGAARTGAHSTPSFYIEGGLMEGLYPLEVYRRVLDSIYAVKRKPKP